MFETIIFLLLVVVLIVLLTFKANTGRAITILQSEIIQLREQLKAYREKLAETPPVVREALPRPPETEMRPAPDAMRVSPPVPEPAQPTPPVEAATPIQEAAIPESAQPTQTIPPVREAAFTATREPEPEQEKPSFWDNFLDKNPDLEKFIGENLFNKIGIAVLVLGIGFFLKYAIDKQWINEIGRTFIGIICGGLLIGVAHRLRKTFAPFSSVLIGGGVSVLYFTITIAFHQYHLIGQTLAFILTVLITAFTVFLSLAYNRKELAIIAILGGFSAPFMVSTGEGNIPVLFSYILILNIGMLVLAYFKKWNVVNVICYAATVILYGSWLVMSLNQTTPARPVPYAAGLIFGTLFYLVFFLMNVVNNVKNRARFSYLDISILLTNTFLYYAAGMAILYQLSGTTYQGLFTVLIAVFNCAFAYSLYKNERVDRTLIFLLIGLVLTFASLTAPVQLHGNYITMFWAAETVLLCWLWQKSGIVLMKYVSVIILGLMFVSLVMDWTQIEDPGARHLLPFINRVFITGAVAVVAVFLLLKLSRNEARERPFVLDIPVKLYRVALGFFSIVLIYITVILELWYQSSFYFPLLTPVVTGTFNYVFVTVLLFTCRRRGNWRQFVALGLCIGLALAWAYPLYYNWAVIDLRTQVLAGKAPAAWFFIHYLLPIGWVCILYQLYRIVLSFERKDYMVAFQWFASVMVLYMASASLDQLVAYIAGGSGPALEQVLHNTHRVGFAILWGAFAFVLIYLGLRWKSKMIRIISISVFGITLLKLFFFDFAGLGEGGKIAAFISLGIILLIISFMYQRLKRILFTDESSTIAPETHE
ncbi:DUF2339 domain-containing protein [Chitinophaga agrisoli]|uniref:DUF2339 domain-containing protein n=1 Tax=Chitinophaga agrisoli TaxID=2607653 RepID=A0A5B2W336_9BACT|nr:DUF2339 domain-containing protein [Chitinophaga agrisoli]KAA2244917.1 DUF2339 domain-containing protein [Chitinophaga agrisoli]